MQFDIQTKRRRSIGKWILLRVCFRHSSPYYELFKPEGSGLISGPWNPRDGRSSLLLRFGGATLDAARNRTRGGILRLKSCLITTGQINFISRSSGLRGTRQAPEIHNAVPKSRASRVPWSVPFFDEFRGLRATENFECRDFLRCALPLSAGTGGYLHFFR